MPETTIVSKDRLIFLAKEFDVFTPEDLKMMRKNALPDDPNEYIKGIDKDIIAIKKTVYDEAKKKPTINISVSSKIFTNMIKADPTEQKANLSWLLHSFRRLIRDGHIRDAVRFADEDLRTANEYLMLFEANKRKKKFIEWSKKSEYRKWRMTNRFAEDSEWEALNYNPSDITQYKSLSQLFDAVDPFMDRSPSDLERAMQHFVDMNMAEIPFRDRKWTIYVPLSMDANCVMGNFASWCTARHGNTMYDNYTKNYKTPILGKPSKIYVIINNAMFSGESDECYQIHFESRQIKDRSNSNVSFYEKVLSTSEGMAGYFFTELDKLARLTNSLDNNVYLDYLIAFGFTDSLFDYLETDIPAIKLKNREIPKLPDISRFKNLDQLLLMSIGLHELHPSIGELNKLELLALSGNKLRYLPKEIGKLKNVDFINLMGNPLEDIPDEIGELDKTRGGKLYRISISAKDVGEDNIKKLKKLLPTVNIVDGSTNN